jgi:hypothetical protein
MPALRPPRRELFVQNLIKSAKNGMNYTEAYIAAGYKGRGHTAEVGASRLMSRDEVKMRIDELTRPVVRKTRVSIESLLNELEITIQDARADGQHGTVVAALTLSAKLVGLLRDRIEVGRADEFAGLSTEEVVDKMIEDIGGGSAQKMLDHFDHIRAMIEERAASKAAPVSTSSSSKPTMSEATAALEKRR